MDKKNNNNESKSLIRFVRFFLFFLCEASSPSERNQRRNEGRLLTGQFCDTMRPYK